MLHTAGTGHTCSECTSEHELHVPSASTAYMQGGLKHVSIVHHMVQPIVIDFFELINCRTGHVLLQAIQCIHSRMTIAHVLISPSTIHMGPQCGFAVCERRKRSVQKADSDAGDCLLACHIYSYSIGQTAALIGVVASAPRVMSLHALLLWNLYLHTHVHCF